MSNIKVNVNYTIKDGASIAFRSPVDCSQVTGLVAYYPGEDGNTASKEFAFADAHGNNVGDIDHLFAENVVVKVILDVTAGMAFVQNADTNAYLEGQFEEIRKSVADIRSLPTVTTDENGKVLTVVDGKWAAEDVPEDETNCLPEITTDDNDKILQVIDGVWTKTALADSSIATYIDNYINEALGGEY